MFTKKSKIHFYVGLILVIASIVFGGIFAPIDVYAANCNQITFHKKPNRKTKKNQNSDPNRLSIVFTQKLCSQILDREILHISNDSKEQINTLFIFISQNKFSVNGIEATEQEGNYRLSFYGRINKDIKKYMVTTDNNTQTVSLDLFVDTSALKKNVVYTVTVHKNNTSSDNRSYTERYNKNPKPRPKCQLIGCVRTII